MRFRVFAWVAREPELMCGAKGRASSTEINRLTQLNSTSNPEFAVPLSPLVTAHLSFATGIRTVRRFRPPDLFI